MNISVLLAVAASFTNTWNDLLYRKISKGDEKKVLFFYGTAAGFSVLFAFLWTMIIGKVIRTDTMTILYGLIAGVFSFFTYIFYLKSLGCGGNTSSVVTIFRLNSVPAILLAVVFLNETIDIRKGIAILLCLVCVFLFYENSADPSDNQKKGLLYGSLACVFSGCLNFVNKISVKNGAESLSVLFYRFATVALVVLMILLVKYRKDFHGIKGSEIAKPALSGFILLLAIVLLMEAYKTGDLSVVTPLTNMSFVFVAVICRVFYKEKISLRKWIGIAVAVVAIILIN